MTGSPSPAAERLVASPVLVRRHMDLQLGVDGLCGLCGAAWPPGSSCPPWRIAGWVAPVGWSPVSPMGPWPSADFWTDGSMAAALAAHDFGSVFRALSAAGLSQTAMAARFGMSQPEISAVMRGGRRVRSYEVIVRIVDGLGVPRGRAGVSSCSCAVGRAAGAGR